MIAIEGLSFRFRGSQDHAIRNVSLKIAPGEFLVITGPSGCGKSTLALAMGGYLFRQFDGTATGQVTVAGMDARQAPIYDLAEVVGLVQQNPEAQFCTLTVTDEVAFGLENRCLPRTEIRDRMDWALGIVGAQHLAGRALASLSGGEQQKVAIAAMMATKPQVLIFDEPTSNLDPPATAEIFEVIEHIRDKAGITVVVIEHKVGYLRRFAPRLVEMDQGQIVQDGILPTVGARTVAGRQSRVPGPTAQSPGSLPRHAPLVRVENLHAGHNGRPLLRDLTLEVWPGDLISVMGDNGSGKTTLLRCLLGLHRPSRGRVEVLGRDTSQTPVSQLARQVGIVFQNPDHQLFADSVWDEAVFAPRNFSLLDDATQEHARRLLDLCGLGHRLADHPYRLSYGQKRRLNLVSVLSYAPRLVLLDEVLIGQDPVNAGFLLDLLAESAFRGGAVVLVNHAPRITNRYVNRLLFLNSGQIVVDAPTTEAVDQLRALGKDAYAA